MSRYTWGLSHVKATMVVTAAAAPPLPGTVASIGGVQRLWAQCTAGSHQAVGHQECCAHVAQDDDGGGRGRDERTGPEDSCGDQYGVG